MFKIFKLKSYLPYGVYKTIFDIDYKNLFNQNKRYILIDLDNTIIPYDVSIPNQEHVQFFEELINIGFKVVIISNNKSERVGDFAATLKVPYVSSAAKPLKRGYKKAFKILNIKDTSLVIAIGDQLMTDVLGGSRVNIDTILVKAIKKKSEKWYTKINRHMERITLNRIKKKYPEVYNKIMKLED